MLLQGTGRQAEFTGIRRDVTTAALRRLNRESAEAIYHARMTQIARAGVGLAIDSRETFRSYSESYETHHTAKHRAASRERFLLAHLRAFFDSMHLADIGPNRWAKYETARLKAGVSINTSATREGRMRQRRPSISSGANSQS
jgi:hypothetical protein